MSRFDTGHSLLLDAKVYVLAQYLQLDHLKRLAFYEIQYGLDIKSEVYGTRLLLESVDLARYVYASTDSLADSEEPLRKLVSTYIAVSFSRYEGPEIEGLMSEGGELVVDVTRKVRRQLTVGSEPRREVWKATRKATNDDNRSVSGIRGILQSGTGNRQRDDHKVLLWRSSQCFDEIHDDRMH